MRYDFKTYLCILIVQYSQKKGPEITMKKIAQHGFRFTPNGRNTKTFFLKKKVLQANLNKRSSVVVPPLGVNFTAFFFSSPI